MLWIEADSLGIVGNCVVVVTLVPVTYTTIVIGQGIFRIESNGLCFIGDLLVEVTFLS